VLFALIGLRPGLSTPTVMLDLKELFPKVVEKFEDDEKFLLDNSEDPLVMLKSLLNSVRVMRASRSVSKRLNKLFSSL
jgi:hypothetical protein